MDKFKFAPFFLLVAYLGLFFVRSPSVSESIVFLGLAGLFLGQLLLSHFSRPKIEDQIIVHKNELLKELENKDKFYKEELDKVRNEFSDQLTKISMNLLKTSQMSKGGSVGDPKKPVW